MSERLWNEIVEWAKKDLRENSYHLTGVLSDQDKAVVWASERIAELEQEVKDLNLSLSLCEDELQYGER